MSDEAEALAALEASQQGEGAVSEAAPSEGQAEPFLSYKWDDGKEDVWHTQDEMKDWLRQHGFRQSDYTRKTQDLSENRKVTDRIRKEAEEIRRKNEETWAKLGPMDEFLRKNPTVAQRIAQEMAGRTNSPDVEALVHEAIKPLSEKLSKYEQEEQRRKALEASQAARDAAYARNRERFSDWDDAAMDARIKRFEEMPEQMRAEALLEELYYAGKGRSMTPGEAERKAAMRRTRSPSPTSTVNAPSKSPGDMSEKEAFEAAIAALESAGGGG